MSLLAQIKADQVAARKARDVLLAATLTTLLSEASAPGLNDGKRESTDDEVEAVIKKFIKNINDTITAAGEDSESSVMLFRERSVYESYLPKALTEDELRTMIGAIVGGGNVKNIGQVMGMLKASGENYDGKMASRIAKEELAG